MNTDPRFGSRSAICLSVCLPPVPGDAAGPGGGSLAQLYEGALKVLGHGVQPRTQVGADILGSAAQLWGGGAIVGDDVGSGGFQSLKLSEDLYKIIQ